MGKISVGRDSQKELDMGVLTQAGQPVAQEPQVAEQPAVEEPQGAPSDAGEVEQEGGGEEPQQAPVQKKVKSNVKRRK